MILNSDVLQFCYEEVQRQGWDTDTPMGEVRVLWMLKAWAAAGYARLRKPNATDVRGLGKLVERYQNMGGWRRCGVRVGTHVAPPAEQVPRLMSAWSEAVAEGRFTPDEAYIAFEEIHPFIDGNGRVGKILHNWLSGTLDTPVLVKNYFGGTNP